MRKIKMFSSQADCVGSCSAPSAKVASAKTTDSHYNKDRVSRATAVSNYARSPRALAHAGGRDEGTFFWSTRTVTFGHARSVGSDIVCGVEGAVRSCAGYAIATR